MRFVQALWVRFPLLVARWWPGAGIVLGDGHYLSRWPVIALAAQPLAWAGGVAAGSLHDGRTYTYSMVVMCALTVAGQAGACLGLWATLGYAVGDLFLNRAPRPDGLLTVTVPDLLSYVLLGLLSVLLPVAVLWARRNLPVISRLPTSLLPWLDGLCAAVVAGAGGFVWAKVVPLLIQPIFTWPGGTAEEIAVAPLRDWWWVLVVTTAWAAIARVVAEHEALSDRVLALSHELWEGLDQRLEAGPRRGIGGLIVVVAGAAGTTWLVSGLIGNYWQAAVAFVYFGSLLFVRFYLVTVGPAAVELLTRVPAAVRILVALGLAYGAGWLLTRAFPPAESNPAQASLLVSACLAALVLTLLTIPKPPAALRDS